MQQINLYSWPDRPGPYDLNPKRATVIFLGVIVLFVFIILTHLLLIANEQIRLNRLQTKEADYKKRALVFKMPIGKKAFDNMREQVQYQEQLLSKIQAYKTSLPFQPSSILEALATDVTSDIAISKITLENQGKKMVFDGTAVNSNSVFDFVKKLRSTVVFYRATFKTVAVNDDKDKKQIVFTITAEIKEP